MRWTWTLFLIAGMARAELCPPEPCGCDGPNLVVIETSLWPGDPLLPTLGDAVQMAAMAAGYDPDLFSIANADYLFPETSQPELGGYARFQVPGVDLFMLSDIIPFLSLHPLVAQAQLDVPVMLSGGQGQPAPDTWIEQRLDLEAAHQLMKDHQSQLAEARVAVIDSGVDHAHADLARAWLEPTVDVTCRLAEVEAAAHGTHCIGIIAANSKHPERRTGVAPNARIYPIKAFAGGGTTCASTVARGVEQAMRVDAHVISMSFSTASYSQVLYDVLQLASKRAVLVAAAGNDGLHLKEKAYYPAAWPFVVGVEAEGCLGKRAWFSNSGYELTMPGKAIGSTVPGDRWLSWSGTSMAAPFAAGVAALARSLRPDLSPARIRELLIEKRGNAFDILDEIDTLPRPFATSTPRTFVSKMAPVSIDTATIDKNTIPGQVLGAGMHLFSLTFTGAVDTRCPPIVRYGPLGEPATHHLGPGTWVNAKTWKATFLIDLAQDWDSHLFRVEPGSCHNFEPECFGPVEIQPNAASQYANQTNDDIEIDIQLQDCECIGDDQSWSGFTGFQLWGRDEWGPLVPLDRIFRNPLVDKRDLPPQWRYLQYSMVGSSEKLVPPIPGFELVLH